MQPLDLPPVMVGEYGAVSRCVIPLSWQTRSNSAGPGPRPEPRREHFAVEFLSTVK